MIEKHINLPTALPNLTPPKDSDGAHREIGRTSTCSWLRRGKRPIVIGQSVDCSKGPKLGCPYTENRKIGINRTSRKIDLEKVYRYQNDMPALGQWMLEQTYGVRAIPEAG